MQTKTVAFGTTYRVTVSEATVAMGFRRSQLRTAAAREAVDFEERILGELTYPDLVAATLAVEGLPWPLDFASFLALPEQLLTPWEAAVYDLNPHWLPTEPSTEQVDRLALRLAEKHERLKAEKDLPPELPEAIHLNEPETAYQLYQLLELSGWRWPPDVLLRQPEALLTDILQIASIDQKVEKMVGKGAPSG
jgi:hypothetical protein